MRRFAAVFIALLLVFPALFVPCAMAAPSDYVGSWVAVATDRGSGIEKIDPDAGAEYQLRLEFMEDGTLSASFWGLIYDGTWAETEGGISATLNGQEVAFTLENGQLVNDADGTVTYFGRTDQKPVKGAQPPISSIDYTGCWVSTSLDMGDGKRLTEDEGHDIQGMMVFRINGDGTLHLDSAASGDSLDGTWVEISGGIAVTIQKHTENMTYVDGALSIGYNGATVYLERNGASAQVGESTGTEVKNTPLPTPEPTAKPEVKPTPKPAPKPTPKPTAKPRPAKNSGVDYTGTWSAALYQDGDTWNDARRLFPKGFSIEIRPDGTGSASIGGAYAEDFIWSMTDEGLTIDQSNLFQSTAWDAARGELEFHFGVNGIPLVFERGGEQAQSDPRDGSGQGE